MHISNTLPLFAGLTAALTLPHLEQRQTQPANVRVAEISYAGSGCSANTVTGQAATDPTTLTVPQVNFIAQSGQNQTRVVENRKNCSVLIKVSHAAGWQFSPAKADYYGRVILPLGVEATSKSTYFFSGSASSTQISKQYYFDGPYSGIYFRNDRWTAADTGRLWSACGSEAMLNINTEVRVNPQIANAPSRNASMEVWNLLGGKLGVTWRKC